MPRNIFKHVKSRVAKTLVLLSILGAGSYALIVSRTNSDLADHQRSAGISWGYDFSNSTYGGIYDTWAGHDMIITQARDLWQTSRSTDSVGYIDSVHARNPDAIFLAYYPFDNVYHFQKEVYENYESAIESGIEVSTTSAVVPIGPGNFDYDTWKLFVDNPTWLARTNQNDATDGLSLPDTFSAYRRNYFANITIPECWKAMADLMIRDYYASEDVAYKPGVGILIDYLQDSIYDEKDPDGQYAANETGLLDLDQDGVNHWDDADERAAWVQASIDQVEYIRSQMPPGFIIISNGQASNNVSEFTEILDGIMYENFPRYHFDVGGSNVSYYEAMNRTHANSLFNVVHKPWVRSNGGPYILIENSDTKYVTDVAIASMLVDGTYCIWRNGDNNYRFYGPNLLDLSFLGAPLDTTTTTTLGDHNWLHTREFEHGKIVAKISDIVNEQTILPYKVYDEDDVVVYEYGSIAQTDPYVPPSPVPVCFVSDPNPVDGVYKPIGLTASELYETHIAQVTIDNVGNAGCGDLSVKIWWSGTAPSEVKIYDEDRVEITEESNPILIPYREQYTFLVSYYSESYSMDASATLVGVVVPDSEGDCGGGEVDLDFYFIGPAMPISIPPEWNFTDDWNGPAYDYMSTMTKSSKFPLVQPNDYWFWHQVGTDQFDPYFDPNHERQWWLDEDHMNAERAWAVATGSSTTGVMSAIIDIYPNTFHDDFKDRKFINEMELAFGDDNIDNDGNGYIDDVYGWNWAVSQSIPEAAKPWMGREDITDASRWKTFSEAVGNNSHGSRMLGMFAAMTNNEDWWLVDPDAPITVDNDNRVAPTRGLYNAGLASLSWNTKVMPLTFYVGSTSGSAWYDPNTTITGADRLAAAIRYVIELKTRANSFGPTYDFRVISMSTVESNDDLILAVDEAVAAGILVVGGAGNSGTESVLPLAALNTTIGTTCSNYNGTKLTDESGGSASNYGEEVDVVGYGTDGTHTIVWNYATNPDTYSYVAWNSTSRNMIPTFGYTQTQWNNGIENAYEVYPTFKIVGNDSTAVANSFVYSSIQTTDALTSGSTAQAAGLATLVAAAAEENNWNNGEPLSPQQLKYMIRRGALNIDALNTNTGYLDADCTGLLGQGRMDAYTTLTLWGTIPRDTLLTGDVYVSGDIKIPNGVDVTVGDGTRIYIAPDNILEDVSGYDTVRRTLIDITIESGGSLNFSTPNIPALVTTWLAEGESARIGDWGKIIVNFGGVFIQGSATIQGRTP